MLGGGALPPWPAFGRREFIGSGGAPAPPHPPYWPAFGRREILERFAFRSPNLNNNYYY